VIDAGKDNNGEGTVVWMGSDHGSDGVWTEFLASFEGVQKVIILLVQFPKSRKVHNKSLIRDCNS